MALGNQYGIDMGNILSTASNIKTARLNREIKEKTLEKEDAEERNLTRSLTKKHGKKTTGNALVTTQPAIDAEIVEPTPTNALATADTAPESPLDFQLSEEEIKDYALNPQAYKNRVADIESKMLYQRRLGANKSILQLTMPNATEEQVNQLATMKTKDVANFIDMARKGDETQRLKMMDHINKSARQIMTVTQTGNNISDPEAKIVAKQKAWDSFRNNAITSAPTPEAGKKIADEIPATFDQNWAGMKIAESADVYKTVEKINLEDRKQKNTLELEKEKAKTKKDTPTDSYERLIKTRNNLLEKQKAGGLTDIETRTLSDVESKILKENNPAMDAVAKRWEFRDKKVQSFSDSLPEEFRNTPLVDIDTRKFTKAQKSKADSTANAIIQAENPQGSKKAIEDTRKSLVAVRQLTQALRLTEQISKSGKNINLVDKTIRDNFSQYFGMSDNEMQIAFRDKRYASASNVIRNALFGSAVSKQENKNFVDATATLYGTNKNLVLGMKSMLEDVKAKLEINAEIVPPAAFNLKFGDRMDNLNDLISSIDGVIEGKPASSAEDIKRLRETKSPKGIRVDVYNNIKAQRPNATDAQINTYLDSKGY